MLVDLGKRTFFDTFATQNNPDDIAQYLKKAFSPQQIQTEILASNSLFLLVYPTSEATCTPVGYAKLLRHSTEPSVLGRKPIELGRLYVDKSAIGQGYGARLMQACLERATCEGFETIWLGVWERNYRAQAFYKRWGFQPVGTHDFVVGQDVQTDLIYTRLVNQPE